MESTRQPGPSWWLREAKHMSFLLHTCVVSIVSTESWNFSWTIIWQKHVLCSVPIVGFERKVVWLIHFAGKNAAVWIPERAALGNQPFANCIESSEMPNIEGCNCNCKHLKDLIGEACVWIYAQMVILPLTLREPRWLLKIFGWTFSVEVCVCVCFWAGLGSAIGGFGNVLLLNGSRFGKRTFLRYGARSTLSKFLAFGEIILLNLLLGGSYRVSSVFYVRRC